MKKIFKYEVLIQDYFSILLPKEYQILTVETQHEIPYIWVIVNTESEEKSVNFRLCGTGHPLGITLGINIYSYIGTFQLRDGNLIFHLFELP